MCSRAAFTFPQCSQDDTGLQFSSISLPGSCLFHEQQKSILAPAGCRQIALLSHPPAEVYTLSTEVLSKTISFTTFFSPMLSKGYRSFWSTSKRCWQGHNWTFLSAQHGVPAGMIILPGLIIPCPWLQHPTLLHGTYPTRLSGSSPFLPLLTLSKAFPRRPLAHRTPNKPFQVFAPAGSRQKALSPSSSKSQAWAPCPYSPHPGEPTAAASNLQQAPSAQENQHISCFQIKKHRYYGACIGFWSAIDLTATDDI